MTWNSLGGWEFIYLCSERISNNGARIQTTEVQMSLKMLVRSFLGTLFQLHTRSFQSFYKKHDIFVDFGKKYFLQFLQDLESTWAYWLAQYRRSDWASSDLEYIHRVRRNSYFSYFSCIFHIFSILEVWLRLCSGGLENIHRVRRKFHFFQMKRLHIA